MPSEVLRANLSGCKDLRLSQVEAERCRQDAIVSDLQAKVTSLGKDLDEERTRADHAESSLAKICEDHSRARLQVSNLEQALAKAQAQVQTVQKVRRQDEQRKCIELDLKHREAQEDLQQLKNQCQMLEAQVSQRTQELQRATQGQETRRAPPSASFQPSDVELEVETRMSKAKSVRSRHNEVESFDSALRRPSRRRPRASSVGSCSEQLSIGSVGFQPSCEVDSHQCELSHLRESLTAAIAELNACQARAEKAEREALKSSNEQLASERCSERRIGELKSRIEDLEDDLYYKAEQLRGVDSSDEAAARSLLEERAPKAEAKVHERDEECNLPRDSQEADSVQEEESCNGVGQVSNGANMLLREREMTNTHNVKEEAARQEVKSKDLAVQLLSCQQELEIAVRDNADNELRSNALIGALVKGAIVQVNVLADL